MKLKPAPISRALRGPFDTLKASSGRDVFHGDGRVKDFFRNLLSCDFPDCIPTLGIAPTFVSQFSCLRLFILVELKD